MQLVFDLDGTLFQTAECTVNAVRRLRGELGLPPVSDETAVRNIGKTSGQFLRAALWDGSGVDFARVGERLRELERREVAEHGALFPGIHEMLKRLSQKHTLCICSNGSAEYISLVLSSTGIARFFSAKLSTGKFESKTAAVKALLHEDRTAAVIGDTVADAEAAKANRLPFILAAYGYGRGFPSELEAASFTAGNAGEVEAQLNRIELFYKLSGCLRGKRVVGISGVDTSGKTEFTQAYSKFLTAVGVKNQVLHLDDFHNPSAVRGMGGSPVGAYYQNAFNYGKLIREVLAPLREKGRLDKTVTCLDLDTDEYRNRVTYRVEEDAVLLIEGVLLFRPPVLSFLNGTIFLDIPFDEMLRRARMRDVPKYGEAFLQRYREKYIPIQERYLREHRPKERCDVLIDNRDYNAPLMVRG